MNGERAVERACAGSRCATCPVGNQRRCLGVEVRAVAAEPGRLCELAARDARYAIELKRLAGEEGLPPPRR